METHFFCKKDHRLARVEVFLDESTNTVTCGGQAILMNDWCTGSNNHGGGGMAFMENGDMALAVGDMSKVRMARAQLKAEVASTSTSTFTRTLSPPK